MSINRDNYRKWAVKNGYGIDESMAGMIFDGLDYKKKVFQIAMCPCVPTYMHSNDVICPCKEFKNDKICRCGLFIYE